MKGEILTCYDNALRLKIENDQRIYIAYSGGKDSTAMLLRMLELGERIDGIYFANTTLEYPEMYSYIRKINKFIFDNYGKEITWIEPKDSFYKWFYGVWTKGKHKGEVRGFPKRSSHSYCCRELKINPQKLIRLRGITCLGIAFDERSRIQKGSNLRYPLIEWGWTEKDCLKYLISKDLMNPLYKKFDRTGCWLCPKQPIKSLRSLYLYYPNLWNKLKQLEKQSPCGFRDDLTLDQLELRFNKEFYQTKLVR